MLHKVKDQPGYVYDERTGLVINRNEKDLKAYRNQVESVQRANEMERKFATLQDELEQIKKLLGGKGS